jgi:hypothetical protein
MCHFRNVSYTSLLKSSFKGEVLIESGLPSLADGAGVVSPDGGIAAGSFSVDAIWNGQVAMAMKVKYSLMFSLVVMEHPVLRMV